MEVKLPAGLPDCHVLVDGRVVYVELKAVHRESQLKAELRPEQARWIDRWQGYGGEAYVLCHIIGTPQVLWYSDAGAIRRGEIVRCAVPRGVYAPEFDGNI